MRAEQGLSQPAAIDRSGTVGIKSDVYAIPAVSLWFPISFQFSEYCEKKEIDRLPMH